jgi:FKBP-type peptidyl-prolyl cis-trans isomerase FkpA
MGLLFFKRCPCFVVIATTVFLAACGQEEHHRPAPKPFTKTQLEKANQADIRKESDDIDAYVLRHKLDMKTTGTGIRYMYLKKSAAGDSARTGRRAMVGYKVFLLDGTLCYSSDKDGNKEFLIGEDHVESGIHEMIVHMKTGDEVRFILPAALAHGLLGDGDKIPPRAPVLYEMELKRLK